MLKPALIKTATLGREGEDIAVRFLRRKGYRILSRNYKLRCGEVDIIASDHGVICFVEVKRRSSCAFGLPCEYVTLTKRRKIAHLAATYLKERGWENRPARFDVISIVSLKSGRHEIDFLKDAFSDEGII